VSDPTTPAPTPAKPSLSDAARDGVKELTDILKADFGSLGEAYRVKAVEYSNAAAALAADAAAGMLSPREIDGALHALESGLKSEALAAGYASKAEAVKAIQKGIGVALKILVTAIGA